MRFVERKVSSTLSFSHFNFLSLKFGLCQPNTPRNIHTQYREIYIYNSLFTCMDKSWILSTTEQPRGLIRMVGGCASGPAQLSGVRFLGSDCKRVIYCEFLISFVVVDLPLTGPGRGLFEVHVS